MQEVKGLGFLALSVWLLVSLFTYWTPPGEGGVAGRNLGGDAGFYLANSLLTAFGWAGYLAAVLLGSWGCVIVARRKVSWPFVRVIGAFFLVAVLALILQLAVGPELGSGSHGVAASSLDNQLPYGPGGWLAIEITPKLTERFGTVGLWVMLIGMGLISSILATEMAFYPALSALGAWLSERRENWGEEVVPALWGWFKGLIQGLWDFLRGVDLEEAPLTPARARASGGTARGSSKRASSRKAEPELFDAAEDEADDEEESDADEWEQEDEHVGAADLDEDEDEEDVDEVEEDDEDEVDLDRELVPVKASKAVRARQTKIVSPIYDPPTPPPGPWTLPPPDLLEPPSTSTVQDAEFLERSARALEHALKSFRVDAEVVGAQVGPTVTLFELTVAQGTRMNKVTQLSQEIAAALRARSRAHHRADPGQDRRSASRCPTPSAAWCASAS